MLFYYGLMEKCRWSRTLPKAQAKGASFSTHNALPCWNTQLMMQNSLSPLTQNFKVAT